MTENTVLLWRAVHASTMGEGYQQDTHLKDRWFVKQGRGWPSGFGTYATQREARQAIRNHLTRERKHAPIEAAKEAAAKALVTPELLAAFQAMVDAHAALWDAQRDVEDALGFDVDDISEYYDGLLLSHNVGDVVDEDDLVSFLFSVQEHKGK